MDLQEFKAEMLKLCLEQAKMLCEINLDNVQGIKIEPEQKRKNTSTVLSIIHEVEDFFKDICSSSDN